MNPINTNNLYTSINEPVAFDSLLRQLLWSVLSPPLLIHCEQDIWPAPEWFEQQRIPLQALLNALTDEPQVLDAYLRSERDVRLGARFERLLEFWMERHANIDVLARRLQFSQAGRTIGEFDFLVRTESEASHYSISPTVVQCDSQTMAKSNDRADIQDKKRVEHWEVACKFYLGVPIANVMHWIGPGKRDRLVRKLRRIQSHQLNLSNMPGAREMLERQDIHIDGTRALIKGRLFYPWQEEKTIELKCEALPDGMALNPSHERGYWCDSNSALLKDARVMVLLPKSRWLDPKLYLDGPKVDQDTLATLCDSAPQCCDIERPDGSGLRLFVVTPGWFDDLLDSLGDL